MPEQALPQLPERLEQLRARPTAKTAEWFRIEAKASTGAAEVSIYDDIGWEGTTAKDFAATVRALDVDDITLRLNSKGGDAWDGVAIFNALKDHKASVTVVVDGVAASAASVIAQAGDRIVMNRGSQMMIHDASGLALGNAADMRELADMLDKVSDSLAGIYAARAGGTVEEWRATMRDTRWYTAAEAVEAGLADELADDGDKPAARNAAAPPVTAAEAARRIHAASTKTPTATPAAGPTTEGAGMDPAKIREALGLAPDVSDEQVMAALASLRQPATDPAPTTPPATPTPAPAGTMVIDASAWTAQQDRIKALEAADTRRRRDERDAVIAQAVADGKFAPSRTEHWARLWDADPEGTRQVIDGLARNVIPVAALGYDGDIDRDLDEEFAGLFPPAATGKGN